MCLTSSLMSQEKIVILKATKDNVNDVIEKGVYALTNLPNNYNQFERFVLVDEADSNDGRVLAIGNISEPYEVNSNSKSVNIFSNSNLKWEYALSNIVDLRGDILTLEDVLIGKNLNEISYVVQF
ncbi:MAG: hypothetical protein E7212_04980 [Clostridium sartagoforme]|nr:hypothetical protein [Clostridium sartagoforme]